MKNGCISLALCLFFLLCSSFAIAQATTGTLAGNVKDTSGAVIPNAQITALGEQSGVKYTTKSSDVGGYRLPDLLPGTYSVDISAPGFTKSVQKGVIVEVNRVSALDVTLKPGTAELRVTVNETVPTVETQSQDISTTVTNREVQELPLSVGGSSLRSPEAFVFLAPGVNGGPSHLGSGKPGNSGTFAQSISGGQSFGQEVLLDGASVDRTQWHSFFDETAPSVDSIQEFTVTTSTIPAQYSRTAGGVVTFVTKTGTNAFHGVLYDIFRNEALNANTWFNDYFLAQSGNTSAARQLYRTPFDKKNDFGGTLGGPIRVPGLYDGRNKSFFFFSWEQFRENQSATTTSTIPTLAERGGDFSALLGPPTGQTNPCDGTQILQGQIFDPATTQTVGGVTCRTAFPGNIVPLTSFGTVANNTIALLPTPTNSGLTQNFSFSTSFPITNTTWTLRGDQVLSDRQKLALSYSHRINRDQVGLPSLPYPLDPGHQKLIFATDYARVMDTFTVSPTLVNQLTVGYNRYDSAGKMPTYSGTVQWANKLGITNVSGRGFPGFSFSDSQGLSNLGSTLNNDAIDNAYRINDDITWGRGRHTLNFGVSANYQTYFPGNLGGSEGEYTFSLAQTAPTAAAVQSNLNVGSAFASFLLGDVSEGDLTVYSSQPQWNANFFAFYGQDSFKVGSTLVLNYGLNWSVEMPRRERYNHASDFDPTLLNPAAGIPGAIRFADSHNRSFISTYLKDFAPRVGFSWAPANLHGRLAVRGGYGLYYAPLFYGDTGVANQAGFSATPVFNSIDNFTPAFNINNGFPSYAPPPFIDPNVQNGGFPDYLEGRFNAPGYIHNWSFQIQHEIAPDLLFNVGYVGTKGRRLRSSLLAANAISNKALALGEVLGEPITSPDAIAAGVTSPFPGFSALYGGNPTVAQALRPFPQYQSIETGFLLENLGTSDYDALETQLQRRFRNGLNLLVSYTWSKYLTDADGLLPAFASFNGGGSLQDPYNLRGERSLSYEDTPHSLVVSYIYELPLGRKRKFLNHTPSVINAALSGWQISGVQHYLSGQPLSFPCSGSIPGLDNCTRYSFTGEKVAIGKPGPQGGWLNPASLVTPNPNPTPFVPWQFGDVPRVYGGVRNQNYYSESFSVQKNIAFSESRYLEFRAEFFNAFNRHTFFNPNLDPLSTDFGKSFATVENPRQIQLTLRVHY